MSCPRTHHLNNVPRLRGEKHAISLKILHQAGFETARQAATSAERHTLTIVPCPSQISRNKKLLTYFKWSYWGRRKNKEKNIAGKMFFYLLKWTCFFRNVFFYFPKLPGFFGNRQQSNARAGQKKTHVFFCNVRPKSNACAHLKQRTNIVALPYTVPYDSWVINR